jgi:uncharacterized protein (TIGR00730 family)
MNKLHKICVFCGSSDGTDDKITTAAVALGNAFVARDITLVYGAAKIGVMGAIAQTMLDLQGEVIGIIPQFLKVKEVVHEGLTELHITESMHERKLMMQEVSDGFITLPGGFGTLEELFEVLTWQQLGLHKKPIGLLNINGYFDPLVLQLQKMVDTQLLNKENQSLLIVDTKIESLLNKMKAFEAPAVPKWLSEKRT